MSIGPRRRVAARRPFPRLGAAVLAAAAALVSRPARRRARARGLSAVGPVNPATGFPDWWYQDGNGLKLQLCLDGPPFCLAAASDLAPPDEAFWWQAEASVPAGGGTARLVLAQEAAFADGQRISRARPRDDHRRRGERDLRGDPPVRNAQRDDGRRRHGPRRQ